MLNYMKAAVLVFVVCFGFTSRAQALNSDGKQLVNACLKGKKNLTKKNCLCLVKYVQTSPKMQDMFKKANKKLGSGFKSKIMKELKKSWWYGEKYKAMPKNGNLNDEQGVMLGISLNASFECLKQSK